MSRRVAVAGLLALAVLGVAAVWASGGFGLLAWRVAAAQRAAQDALAGELSALRAGQAGAVWGLMALCFGYGFLHAAGPGHGKALIAAAALGSRATAARMTLVAVAGSLAQAATAVLLVFGGLALLGLTARGLTEGAERWVTPAGNLAMAAVGAWILARGIAGLRADGGHDAHARAHGHGHEHEQAAHGTGCGCAAHAGAATTPGATLALVAAMAARPCAGALFLLVIAWRMGWPGAGVAGVAAMGLGTASFTALVAWLAATSRDAALFSAGVGPAARLAAPVLAISAGGLVLALGALGFLGALAA